MWLYISTDCIFALESEGLRSLVWCPAPSKLRSGFAAKPSYGDALYKVSNRSLASCIMQPYMPCLCLLAGSLAC